MVATFDESPSRWFATTRTGRYGEVRYSCDKGSIPVFLAFGEHFMPTMRTLGSGFASAVEDNNAISVSYKVDDGELVEASGLYPNRISSIFVPRKSIAGMARMFSEGKEARIRTRHAEEQHTFIVSLDGFAETSRWVDDKCGFAPLGVEGGQQGGSE